MSNDIVEISGSSEVRIYEEKRQELESKLKRQNNPWGLSPKALEGTRAAMTMLSTKDGMHARVPLVCKGENCPYTETCQLIEYEMAPIGEYCPVEIAQIQVRSQGYANDIELDSASFTDRNLVNELITLDIMLERCKALMAKEGTPVIDMAIGVDREGNEIRQQGVSKAWEAYEKVSKKRDQVYQLLMFTRKDKKGSTDSDGDESASQIIHQIISSDIYTES